MDGEIKTHKFGELLVVVAQHASEVRGPIKFWVNGSDPLSVMVSITVDGGSDDWKLGNQVHAVLVHVFPIFALVDSLQEEENLLF